MQDRVDDGKVASGVQLLYSYWVDELMQRMLAGGKSLTGEQVRLK
jgi:hypothetical protein